ncbi:MAG: hypothetical protein IT356_05385 [Gemmatimonadaceae bacterium]|nr:hypothetical protein [Gemmatimonadaceae bacterium]
MAVVALAAATAAGWPLRYHLPGVLRPTTLPAPREAPPESRFTAADFVGAEKCAGCHEAQYSAWQTSTHGRAGGAPAADVVIAAFSGQPIRFRDAVVIPRVRAGRYEFVVSPDFDTTVVLGVDGAIGGGHMVGGGTQGFVTRRPDGTYRFLPFDWSRTNRTWFCNTGSRSSEGWVPITPAMRLAECGDWPPSRVLGDVPRFANCQGCHASQLFVAGDDTSRVTRFASLSINCESCHGPGRRHAEIAERGGAASADIGLASLATLSKDALLGVCFQCHAVKDQLREGFVSGDSLARFYSISLPALGERPLGPDGHVRTAAYQEAHRYSDCYVNGGMTCTSCHDSHSQGYRDVAGRPLPGRFDDRQCTSCHGSKAVDVVAHTRHAAGSEASRCTTCHMPYIQEPETSNPRTGAAPIRYARSDHSIAIPRPVTDSALGWRDACASCHAGRSAHSLEADIRRLWGPGKPMPSQVAAQVRFELLQRQGSSPGAWPPGDLLAGGEPGARRHVAATVAGIARYLEAVPQPGRSAPQADVDRLMALAGDDDLDVRSLALATLHVAGGNEASVRRRLVRALVREGSSDYGLRIRWALAVGYKGDQWAEAGRASDAAAAYRLGLEVLPRHAPLWNSLGNALRAAGDLAGAAAAYDAAIRIRPAWGLAVLNRGVTRLASGDTLRGSADLAESLRLDPYEPMAWFNAGNLALARGGLDSAAVLLRRAAALDGSMTDAYFQLARIRLLRKDPAGAYAELRRGLAFDSSNAAARDLAATLRKAGSN